MKKIVLTTIMATAFLTGCTAGQNSFVNSLVNLGLGSGDVGTVIGTGIGATTDTIHSGSKNTTTETKPKTTSLQNYADYAEADMEARARIKGETGAKKTK